MRQPIDPFRLGKPGDRKLTEVAPVFIAAYLREARRSNHRAMQAGGYLFQPCCEVDRGTDAGEVEPVSAAAVAVEHRAEMERQPEATPLDVTAAFGTGQFSQL